MSEQLRRRASDYNDQREIDSLIAEEQDPKVRLQLVIMNRIAGSIHSMENILVESTEEHAKLKLDYAEHKKAQEAMENRGKGMALLLNGAKGIIAALIIVTVNFAWNDYQSEKINNRTFQQQNDKRLTDLEQSYTALWTTIKSGNK